MYLTHLLNHTLLEGPLDGETLQPRPLARFEPASFLNAPVPTNWEVPVITPSPEETPRPPGLYTQRTTARETLSPLSIEPTMPVQPTSHVTELPVGTALPPVAEMPIPPARSELGIHPSISISQPHPTHPHTGRLDTPSLPQPEPRLPPASQVEPVHPTVIREINIERIRAQVLPAQTSNPLPQVEQQPSISLNLPALPTTNLTNQPTSPLHQTTPDFPPHPLLPPSTTLLMPRLPAMHPLPSHAPSPQPVSAPAPTIQVTIGRVEVRATPPPASPTRKPTSQPAVMTLDDYLKSRTNGGRQ